MRREEDVKRRRREEEVKRRRDVVARVCKQSKVTSEEDESRRPGASRGKKFLNLFPNTSIVMTALQICNIIQLF